MNDDSVNPYEPPEANVEGANGGLPKGALAAAADLLQRTKGWALLFAIFLLLGAGLMVLGGLAMAFSGLGGGGPEAIGYGIGAGLAYGLFALIFLFPGLRLVRFFKAAGRVGRTGSSSDLLDALDHQRKFWKLAGILFTSLLVFYLLMFAGLFLFMP